MPEMIRSSRFATAFAAILGLASIPALGLAAFAVASSGTTAEAACKRGTPACPIEVRMARGSDTITVRGVLTPARDCCAFALRVQSGQVMTWRIKGPPVVTAMLYPTGQEKGPGLPARGWRRPNGE